MIKCRYCEFEATHIPRLVMVAYKGAGASVMFLDVPACRAHFSTVNQLISNEEWQKIAITIVTAGKLIPRRDLTVVEHVPLKGHEAQAFYRALKAATGGPDVMQITTPVSDTRH